VAVAFLARDAEMVRIVEVCRAARDGDAREIGIVGEAGIGKSALLDALAAAADGAGLLVLRGRAAEHESGVPFALAIDAFDDHVADMHPTRVASVGPDLEAVLPAAARSRVPEPATGGPAERFRYHRALHALIELLGRQRPLAVLLDDLHWADEASVELIAYLLRRPPRVGFLLGFTLRPSEGASRLLEVARRSPNWVELQLAPLPQEAARQLLPADLAPGVRDRVLHDAGGNPLFLLELARRAEDTLPDRLVAGVRQELNDLDDQVRTFAWAAAVAGDPFDVDVAAAAAVMCLQGMGRTLAGKPGGDLFDRAVAELSDVDDARLGRDADVTWSIGAALGIAERPADAVAVLERREPVVERDDALPVGVLGTARPRVAGGDRGLERVRTDGALVANLVPPLHQPRLPLRSDVRPKRCGRARRPNGPALI
jgi:hypothetical protein